MNIDWSLMTNPLRIQSLLPVLVSNLEGKLESKLVLG